MGYIHAYRRIRAHRLICAPHVWNLLRRHDGQHTRYKQCAAVILQAALHTQGARLADIAGTPREKSQVL